MGAAGLAIELQPSFRARSVIMKAPACRRSFFVLRPPLLNERFDNYESSRAEAK